MDRFVSTFTNKIDAKGRVSIPAPFRAVLERDGYSQGSSGGIYCYPSLDAPALDAGGERLAKKIDGLLAGLPDYSDERDELSVALYGDVQVLGIDGDGRIVVPEGPSPSRRSSRSGHFCRPWRQVSDVGASSLRRAARKAREKAQEHRKLFGAGSAAVAGTVATREHGNDASSRGRPGTGHRDVRERHISVLLSEVLESCAGGRRDIH